MLYVRSSGTTLTDCNNLFFKLNCFAFVMLQCSVGPELNPLAAFCNNFGNHSQNDAILWDFFLFFHLLSELLIATKDMSFIPNSCAYQPPEQFLLFAPVLLKPQCSPELNSISVCVHLGHFYFPSPFLVFSFSNQAIKCLQTGIVSLCTGHKNL